MDPYGWAVPYVNLRGALSLSGFIRKFTWTPKGRMRCIRKYAWTPNSKALEVQTLTMLHSIIEFVLDFTTHGVLSGH